jgi:hypothetical protein
MAVKVGFMSSLCRGLIAVWAAVWAAFLEPLEKSVANTMVFIKKVSFDKSAIFIRYKF